MFLLHFRNFMVDIFRKITVRALRAQTPNINFVET
jgi:hypothetical protein